MFTQQPPDLLSWGGIFLTMQLPTITLHNGDCLAYLRTLPDNSVDSVVTDPPYGLGTPPPIAEVMRAWCAGDTYEVKGGGFMSKKWDAFVPQPKVWRECLRVLKPGGHLLAFAGTRTQHLMAVSIEIAGFEIRDMCAWLYGSGFPKALDVSKAIDKELGAEREVLGTQKTNTKMQGGNFAGQKIDKKGGVVSITAPATPEAKQWEGWKTALKPALEPITLARKPIAAKTVAANVLEYGTGALNVDGCRVGNREQEQFVSAKNGAKNAYGKYNYPKSTTQLPEGRYPANLMHDGSEAVLGVFSDSESRYFYHAKASTADRDYGTQGLKRVHAGAMQGRANGSLKDSPIPQRTNPHPTVKPIALMEYLIRLVTPANGTTLDPFMGSGTTGIAAKKQGFCFIGCELETDYFAIAQTRINNTPHKPPTLF